MSQIFPRDPLETALDLAAALETDLARCRGRLTLLREKLLEVAQARTRAVAQAEADELARHFEPPEPRPRGPRFPGDETWDC